jgi:hypothetical protein
MSQPPPREFHQVVGALMDILCRMYPDREADLMAGAQISIQGRSGQTLSFRTGSFGIIPGLPEPNRPTVIPLPPGFPFLPPAKG